MVTRLLRWVERKHGLFEGLAALYVLVTLLIKAASWAFGLRDRLPDLPALLAWLVSVQDAALVGAVLVLLGFTTKLLRRTRALEAVVKQRGLQFPPVLSETKEMGGLAAPDSSVGMPTIDE